MHVAVVGAGVFGVWTAHHLVEAGAAVTLVEAFEAGHSRSSSGDETRILRCGYGPDAIYSEMARASLPQWTALQGRLGLHAEPLWHPSGVLWMAAGDDRYTAATRETLASGGYEVRVLDAATLRAEYRELNTDGIDMALLERGSGVLMARRAVRALAHELARRGVRFVRGRVRLPAVAHGNIDAVSVDGGEAVRADRFVFACGAWLPDVFPSVLGGRIRPTRQVVVYFGTPGGDDLFAGTRWPAWIDFPAGIYGTPDVEGRGVKVGIDEHGAPIDPESHERLADEASVARARAWLSRRVPALASAPVVETRVCQYENTVTGDFLVDRHPDHDNVWIAGGGSGHGFKHGPAVGALVARMIVHGDPGPSRFALAGRATDAGRVVY